MACKKRNDVNKILIDEAYACAIYMKFGNKKHLNRNNNRTTKSFKRKTIHAELNHSVPVYSLQERYKQPQTYNDSIFVPILHCYASEYKLQLRCLQHVFFVRCSIQSQWLRIMKCGFVYGTLCAVRFI